MGGRKGGRRGKEGRGRGRLITKNLQSPAFLFEKPSQSVDPNEVQKSIRDSLNFRCPRCEHRPRRPWPAFQGREKEEDWEVVKTEEMRIKEDLVCFHTKVPFDVKPLGK
jgi:hypothetical protein